MKKHLILLACYISSIISFAQGQMNEALYIYRNDGMFNAFFYSEIDSITTSKADETGREYDEYKSQIVWTQDSVYWIPLEVIDSVSFCRPENKLANGVCRMDDLLPYITDVDAMSLKLSSSVPSRLIPNTGDILLYESFDDSRFPLGFAGKVNSNNNFTIKCDSVNFEDLYDRYVCFGDYAAIERIDDKGNVKRKLLTRNFEGSISEGIDISGTVSSEGFYTTLRGSLTLDLRLICKFEKGKPYFLQLSLSPKAKLMIESGVNGKFNHNFLEEAFNIGLPIPDTPFFLGLKGGPTVSMDLQASVTTKTEGEIGSDMGLVCENGQVSPFFKNTSHRFPTLDISGNIDGSLFAGVHIDFGIYSYGCILSAVIEKEVGAEFVMNMSEKLSDLISKVGDKLNTTKYDGLNDVKIDFNLKGSLGGKVELKLGDFLKLAGKINIGSYELNLNTWKLIPSFKAPQVDMVTQSEATVSIVPEDKLLPPGVNIGLGIWDRTQYVDFHACSEIYRVINEWPLEKYQTTFEGLEPGHEYEVFPLVWWNGIDMKASPTTQFVTKFPTPAKIKNFNVNSASFVRDGFEYNGKIYYYDFAATTNVELENDEGIEDWGYVYKDPDGEKVYISAKNMGTNFDSRYNYYRTNPKSTATLYGYAKYSDNKYAYDEPKEYDLVYTFHPTAYVGEVIADSITSTSGMFEYGFNDVPRTGKCYVAVKSPKDKEPIVQEVAYTEKNTIKFADLRPATTYDYWAYVEYAGETYSSEKKSLTTLTPTAYVEKTNEDNITTTSAEIAYQLSNVPDNAKCYLSLEGEIIEVWSQGEEHISYDTKTFSIPNTEKGLYNLTELHLGTTYTCYAYIEYGEDTWYSNVENFTTKTPPAPIASTGDCSEVTINSATVSCTYENVPEGGDCGIEYTWSNGSKKQSIGNKGGDQKVTISGLEPGTTYTYRAYIEVNGQTYYGGEKTFTTEAELPDLSGTWNCTIYKDDGSVLETPTLTLTPDGKATQAGSTFTSEDKVGGWSISADGSASISFSWTGGSWSNPVYFGETFSGTVNSLSSPSSIEGTVRRAWAGTSEHGSSCKFIMTR